MSVIISMVNGKGGVGKTASAVNLSSGLALAGKKVLVVDLDKQSNLTKHFKVYDPSMPSIVDLLFNDKNPEDVIQETDIENLHVLPATYELEGANTRIIFDINKSREHRLTSLAELDYEYIVIDCPPDLEILTVNALAISDYVLVPMKADMWSLEGLDHITKKINFVRDQFNSKLKLMGIFLTMVDNSAVDRDVKSQLKDIFKDKFFKSSIRYSKLFSRSTYNFKPIVLSNPKSIVSIDYLNLVKEVMKNVKSDKR